MSGMILDDIINIISVNVALFHHKALFLRSYDYIVMTVQKHLDDVRMVLDSNNMEVGNEI